MLQFDFIGELFGLPRPAVVEDYALVEQIADVIGRHSLTVYAILSRTFRIKKWILLLYARRCDIIISCISIGHLTHYLRSFSQILFQLGGAGGERGRVQHHLVVVLLILALRNAYIAVFVVTRSIYGVVIIQLVVPQVAARRE